MNSQAQHIIEKKLNRFYKKYFLNDLIKGAVLFFLFTFLYLFIIGFIEYFFWLPPHSRKWIFYSIIPAVILFFTLFLYRPLLNLLGFKKSLKNEQAAILIGAHFPEIKDKLLNLLQLQNKPETNELLIAGIEQKTQELKPFNFSQAIDFSRNKRYLPLLLIPFLILGVLKWAGIEKDFTYSYQRIVSYESNFQPPAPFSLRFLSSDQLLNGIDYRLKVSVTGEKIPDQLFFAINNGNFAPLSKENDTLFSILLPQPQSDFNIRLKTGNYQYGPYFVHLIYPPVISDIKLKIRYPSYLRQKNTVSDQLTNLSIPEGSILHWSIQTKHTDSIVFILNDQEKKLLVKNNKTELKHKLFNDLTYKLYPQNDSLSHSDFMYSIHVIKDQSPTIFVNERKDSIRFINNYKIQATDDHLVRKLMIYYKPEDASVFKTKQLEIKPGDYIESYFTFPSDLQLDSLKTNYVYYFKVVDNNPYRFQAATSKIFQYKMLSQNKKNEQLLERQIQLLHDFSKQTSLFSKQKQTLNRLSQKLTGEKQLDWQTQQQLQHTIEQENKNEAFFKESIKKFRQILNQFPNDSLQSKKDLEERLKEMEEMKHKQKLLDELKKWADKLDKENLLKKINELKNYSEFQEKSLERMLEITKKYYLRQKFNTLSEQIKDLSKKQLGLSKSNKDKTQDQKQIKNRFDEIQNQLDSLTQLNKSLKQPLKLPDFNTDSKEIKQDINKAMQQIRQNEIPASNQSQKKAGNKMQKMAESMQMAMSGGGEQNSEDIATLQSLLKSLLHFSFKQEKLLGQYKMSNLRESLGNHLLEQNNQKFYFKNINDSLYTLALRNPKISQKILDLAYNIDNELDLTLGQLSELNSYSASQHGQFVLTYSNTLADMISQALDNEKNSAVSKGSGKGKKKGKSFSLPDIIKKQGQSIKKMQQALQKQKEKNGKQGKKKSGRQFNEQESARQYELFKQQQQIKDALEQLQDRFSKNKDRAQLKKILKQMEALNKRLLKEGITRQTLESLKQIQQQLLKLKNASFSQEEEERRQSNYNLKNYSTPDSLFYEKNSKFAPSIEQLKRNKLPVNQDVKKKIINYMRHD